MADLTTSSKGEIIETGGMIQIEARAGGRDCDLASGRSIHIEFPVKEEYKPGMQTFYGERTGGEVDWSPAAPGKATVGGLTSAEVEGIEKPLLLATATEEELWPYIKESSRYPYSSLAAKEEGTVYVSFEVDEDLKPIRPLVEVSATPALDRAAYFVVSNIPRWAPADTIPNAMDYRFLVPLNFIAPKDLTSTDYQKARSFERTINAREIAYSKRALANNSAGASITEVASWAAAYNESITPGNLTSYLLSSAKLGYINCDRWKGRRSRRTDFIVSVPASIGADVKMVFHNEKAFLGGYQSGDQVLFSAVPANQPVTIVALRAIGETAYLATGVTNTSTTDGFALKFEKLSLDDVKERLMGIERTINIQQAGADG
jgi:hypothetical protein